MVLVSGAKHTIDSDFWIGVRAPFKHSYGTSDWIVISHVLASLWHKFTATNLFWLWLVIHKYSGKYKLSQHLNITPMEAQSITSRFLRDFPRVQEFTNKVVASCREKGLMYTANTVKILIMWPAYTVDRSTYMSSNSLTYSGLGSFRILSPLDNSIRTQVSVLLASMAAFYLPL